MNYIDISPTIGPETAVFPGDQAFAQNVSMDFASGNHLKLSSITTTLHIGAHADAPSHYSAKGDDIQHRDLSIYMGPCQVIRVKLQPGERIYPDQVKVEIKAERVLFATGSFANPNKWKPDFNSLSPELIEYLKKKNVVLVGIDTPSIDPADSKKLESHTSVYQNNLAVLEGLVLDKVEEGLYQLIALPLKISGGDASPVRAILVPKAESIFKTLGQCWQR